MSTDRARKPGRSRLALLLVLTTAIFLAQPPTPVFGQKQAFVATGRAKLAGRLEVAQRRALENALWLVAEQAINAIVPSAVRTEHAQSVNAVLARPWELVTAYEVIQRGPSRGYFIIKVRAAVDSAAVRARLQAQGVPVDQTQAEAPAARAPQAPPPAAAPAPPAPSTEPGSGQKATPVPAAPPTPQAVPAPAPSPARPQAGTATPQTQLQSDRPRIAVMLFQLGFTNPKWEQTWDIAVGVTELVEEALHNSGRYRIIERRQIEQVLKEQGFGSSGSVDVATAAKAGRILGVQRLVMGSVSQFDLKTAGAVGLPGLGLGVYQAHVSLTGRVVDTSTAEIMTIVRGSGKADGVVVLAQLEGLTFGGGEFRHSVLGRALDQAIQDLVTKLNGSIGK